MILTRKDLCPVCKQADCDPMGRGIVGEYDYLTTQCPECRSVIMRTAKRIEIDCGDGVKQIKNGPVKIKHVWRAKR